MISPEELLSKIKHDDRNKVDLYPLVAELSYECTSEDVAGTFDRLIWHSPGNKRYLKLRDSSRARLIKDLGGNEFYFVNTCDSVMRHANMEYVLGRYGEKHQKMLVRCRDLSHDQPALPEDLSVRVVCQEQYVMFDNGTFLNAMLEPMTDHNMELGEPDLTEDHLVVRGYFNEDVSITQGRNVYRPGMMVVNSETGKHKPVVECILENTIDPGLIRWPVQGDSLLTIDKSNMQAANLSKAVECLPSQAYEQIEHMEKRIAQLAAETYNADYTLQLYLMLRGAKINDEGKYVTELNHHLARYTNSGKRPVTKLDMVQAMARAAHQHKSQKLARLAGNMLTQDAIWDSTLSMMVGKRAKGVTAGKEEEAEVEETV